jgi:class 3 adenylate cyclase
MLACGVPDYQEDHDAHRVANVALDMTSALARFNQMEGQTFQIMMGIHSGPLGAGVIGTKKYVRRGLIAIKGKGGIRAYLLKGPHAGNPN